jgi:hypothetical protein
MRLQSFTMKEHLGRREMLDCIIWVTRDLGAVSLSADSKRADRYVVVWDSK